MGEIEFPAIDLTSKLWTDENIMEVTHYDSFFYSSSESDFLEFAKNHLIVDINGRVFKIVNKQNLSVWRKFIPTVAISKLIFEFQNKTISKDEIKKIMLEKVKGLSNNELLSKHINKATSVKELIGGL